MGTAWGVILVLLPGTQYDALRRNTQLNKTLKGFRVIRTP